MLQFFSSIIDKFLNPLQMGKKKVRRQTIVITKRQKFVSSVFILSAVLFTAEYIFGNYTVAVAFVLGILSDIFLALVLFEDIKANFNPQAFVLPFFCSLSFGLFYFLTPARFISRVVLTILYALALYSLFLSENIFVVAATRTIALLNSARIVTFIITLVSYFFLINILLSLRLNVFATAAIFLLLTVFFIYHSLWTYSLEKHLTREMLFWIGIITLCLSEIAITLWFWPTSPTVTALFIDAMFYIFIGLSHVWFDKRFFKGVFWEFGWVAIFATIILIWFTNWTG